MIYAPVHQIKSARHIARSAQQQIKNETGMRVKILLYPVVNAIPEEDYPDNGPEEMLRIIAIALNMDPRCYTMKTRARNIVELRFIAALQLRTHFPCVTLFQIAHLFGQDHSSVISGMARANELIGTGDLRFLDKYNLVLKTIDLWLKKAA